MYRRFHGLKKLNALCTIESEPYPGCPDGHVHGVEELEAEAVLLRGTLDQLARAQHDGADPVAALQGAIRGRLFAQPRVESVQISKLHRVCLFTI